MAVGSVGKRKAERRGCQVKAQVLQFDGADPIDCTILDFSATGARVKLNAPSELPARFKLYIPSRPETKSVILRWVRGLEFGVEYSTGLADERTFFELIERVAKLEKTGGGQSSPDAFAVLMQRIEALEARLESSRDAVPASTSDVDASAILKECVAQATDAAESLVGRAEQSLEDRVGKAEERLHAAVADFTSQFARRFDEMEASRASSIVASAGGVDPQEFAAVKEGVAAAAAHADKSVQRVEQSLSARIERAEEKLRAELAPETAERLARLEAQIEELASAPAPKPVEAVSDGPDPRMVARIADLEAKLMSAPRAAPAFDGSALEARIEAAERRAEEQAARVERFAMTRLDDLEAQMISAPAATAAGNSVEMADLEFKLHEVAARVEELHRSPALPATAAPTLDELDRLVERVSDLEVAVMDLRIDQPARETADGDDLPHRIAEIEGRHAEIIATLRNLLALLSASESRRAAS